MSGKGRQQPAQDGRKLRLDKWLWAARFFKTRGLATEAIKGGKIELNGSRAKPSREVKVDDELRIRQGFDERTVIVRGLSDRRGPATVARQLYEETPESVTAREKAAKQRRLANAHRERGQGRPSKRERRQIHSFTGK